MSGLVRVHFDNGHVRSEAAAANKSYLDSPRKALS